MKNKKIEAGQPSDSVKKTWLNCANRAPSTRPNPTSSIFFVAARNRELLLVRKYVLGERRCKDHPRTNIMVLGASCTSPASCHHLVVATSHLKKYNSHSRTRCSYSPRSAVGLHIISRIHAGCKQQFTNYY